MREVHTRVDCTDDTVGGEASGSKIMGGCGKGAGEEGTEESGCEDGLGKHGVVRVRGLIV